MTHEDIRCFLGEASTMLSEEGENPEYDRAIVEICTFMCGRTSEHVSVTEEALRLPKNGETMPERARLAVRNEKSYEPVLDCRGNEIEEGDILLVHYLKQIGEYRVKKIRRRGRTGRGRREAIDEMGRTTEWVDV